MVGLDIPDHRLHNQRIARSTLRTPAEVVSHLGAVQAQDYEGAKWAIGLRLSNVTEADIEKAIAERTIVRTWPMRGTLHFVAAADVRWMLQLLTPRVVARTAGRYRQLELDEGIFERSKELFVKALSGGKQLTRPVLYRLLEDAGIAMTGGGRLDSGQTRGLHILAYHAQRGLICFGAREGKQQTFALLDEWAPGSKTLERDEALAELAKRYFTSHGPATLRDFVWWSGLTVREARAGLEMANRHLVKEVLEGRTYWLPSSAREPTDASPTAYLLPPFDEYTVAYRDRSAVLDPMNAKQASSGGIFRPTIVIDGRVVGTWKSSVKKDSLIVTPSPFAKLNKAEQDALSDAAECYGRFRDMPVSVDSGDL